MPASAPWAILISLDITSKANRILSCTFWEAKADLWLSVKEEKIDVAITIIDVNMAIEKMVSSRVNPSSVLFLRLSPVINMGVSYIIVYIAFLLPLYPALHLDIIRITVAVAVKIPDCYQTV